MKKGTSEFHCPTCGKALSPNAKSCTCGALRGETGWLAPEIYDGLDVGGGDDDFDYEEFLRKEFGKDGRGGNWFTRMTPKERFWWIVAVVLLAAFLAMSLAGW